MKPLLRTLFSSRHYGKAEATFDAIQRLWLRFISTLVQIFDVIVLDILTPSMAHALGAGEPKHFP